MKIVLTGDWHLTGKKEQFKFVKNVIQKIDYPLILMGDMIDAGLNRGMNWDQESPGKQNKDFEKIIKGKEILGYVLGNHELRIMKAVGLNIYQSILGDEKSHIKINKRYIVIEHGTRAPQNPVLQLEDLALDNPRANLVALGHNHNLMIYGLNKKQWICRTGHLQLYPDYARRKVLKQRPAGYIVYDTKDNTCEIVRV